jgi:mRNA-degrading endonuclease RelE of RelBE toxin-antitoxin system
MHQRRKEIFHTAFRNFDLPTLENKLQNPEKFKEFLSCLTNEMELIQRDPIHNGSSKCEFPPLLAYRKKKFFSNLSPKEGEKPDMRLLYKFDEETNTIYYFAVGERIKQRPTNPDDIYQNAQIRDQTFKQ